jgi:hypothetical protein
MIDAVGRIELAQRDQRAECASVEVIVGRDCRRSALSTQQVWVHLDYGGYRQAYIQFGMPVIPRETQRLFYP